jgi:putative Ig domain-containing protein
MRAGIIGWVTGIAYGLAATTAAAATIQVPAGGDLQAALDAAQPGDTITLEPNATYVGNFVLPYKGDTTDDQYITIRSAAPDSAFPDYGVRITPAFAAYLPKIKSPNASPSLQTVPRANHYRLMYLEFQSNVNGAGDIISIGAADSTQTDLSQVPYKFILDRLYVHGDAELGQKRCVALHSSDTVVVNSWVSDCKAILQEAQAISGFNGPGNWLIENNYLEGAAQNFLLGGSDPPIPNLVTTHVVFRYNHLRKPLAWRDPILAAPLNVTAAATPAAGALPAGTYFYKVVARKLSNQNRVAVSVASTEVSATLDADGAVTISWTPVATAQDYLVYGRASSSENVFWTTTNPYFTDRGDTGSAGKPGSGTKWMVKNIFELKNAQDVVVEDNVFENNWVADQPGYAIVFTPRNQNTKAPWVVVKDVIFRNNIVRHTAGGVNILSTDNVAKSQLTSNITITNNLFDDLTAATWGAAKVFLVGGDAAFIDDPATGADRVTIDHNTIVSTQSAIYYLYGRTAAAAGTRVTRQLTNVTITNNMSPHNSFGLFGDRLSIGISALPYMPNGIFCANVLAGGSAKQYATTAPPAGFGCVNFLPAATDWPKEFVTFAAGDYHLLPGSKFSGLGPDVDVLTNETALAVAGDIRLRPGMIPVRITPNTLANARFNVPYSESLSCIGGGAGCALQTIDSTLPGGLEFDPVSGEIKGTPSEPTTGLLTVRAFDRSWDFNDAIAILQITVDPPPFAIEVPDVPAVKVGESFQLAPSVSGALGSVAWAVVSGDLPAGLTLDGNTGAIAGTPQTWGTTSAVVEARDSDRWGLNRTTSSTVTITVAPRPVQIVTAALPETIVLSHYEAALSAMGGTGKYTWSIVGGSLPPGLGLDAVTGAVAGEPQRIGRYAFTVRLVDVWPGPEYTATAAVTLVVAPPPLVIATAALPGGDVPKPYRAALQFTGGTGSTMWSVIAGQLPSGLSLSPDGVIDGKLSAVGVFTFTIQASDVGWDGNVAMRTFTVAVRAREVVLYASDARTIAGTWSLVADATAAGGARVWNPNKTSGKIGAPLANPSNYFEISFQAEAGLGYHLWLRGKADKDKRINDAVFVQFSGSVDGGVPVYRIGTTSGATVNLADCNGCRPDGWGWQDNAFGTGVMAAPIFFEKSGVQTIRVQVKEDGFSIDQIVLSSETFTSAAPGALQNDATIVAK